MNSRKKPPFSYTLAAVFASVVLLNACGQTGSLRMPETYSTKKPAPPPRESRLSKDTPENAQEENTANDIKQPNQGK